LFKKRIPIFLVALAIIIGISTKIITSADPIKVSVTVTTTGNYVYAGYTLDKIKASVWTQNWKVDDTITWSSSNKELATVDSKTGVVTGVAPGNVVITATSNYDSRISDSCNITVKRAVSAITLKTNATSFTVNKTYPFTATLFPEDATDKSLTWTTSDTSIAKVDALGNVSTLNKTGKVKIIATSNDEIAKLSNVQGICEIEVKIPVTSISLDKSSLNLSIPNTSKLTATVSPNNATYKNVTWNSLSPDIASVDSTGCVTAIKAGTAVITATSEDDTTKTVSCTVTVKRAVTELKLDKAFMNLKVSDTSTLSATVNPVDATNKDISWSSTDNKIVTVDSTGNIKAIAAGTATIKATSKDNNDIFAVCVITVKNPVSGISLKDTTMELYPYQKSTLNVSILPADATNKAINWTSSNNDVVTIDTAGNIEALAPGTATITVTSQDNNSIKAQCTVTVKNIDITDIKLSKSEKQYDKDLKLTTSITTTPSGHELLYQVWVEDSNGWRMVKNFEDGIKINNNTSSNKLTPYDFTIPYNSLTKNFSYKVHVRIKDSETGVVYSQKTETAECVDSQQLALDKLCTDAAVEGQCTIGDNITITAYGKNISEYEFSISNGSSWDIIKESGPSNSCPWKPKQAGNYILKVTAKNGIEDQTKELTLPFTITVPENEVYKYTELTSFDVPKELTLGDECTISANGCGMDWFSLQYRFEIGEYMRNLNLMQDYTSQKKNVYTWKPNNTGIYCMRAYIKDGQSSYSQDRIERFCKVTKPGQYIKINSVALNNSSNQSYALNTQSPTTFTFDVNASDGKDSKNLQYSFWRYDERGCRLIKDYSEDKTFSWTPLKPGVYSILVRVKGKDSGSYEDEKYFTYTITDPATSCICINDFSINGSYKRMTNHVLSANANNTITNQTMMYKFAVTSDLYGYKELQAFSPLSTYNWLPNKVGKYKIIVYVKDAASGSHEKIITEEITITN